jgi:hypothetical protein
MSDTLLLALIGGSVSLLVSLSASFVALWKWGGAEREKLQAETDKMRHESLQILTDTNTTLLENQQKQYDTDTKELRQTIDYLREMKETVDADLLNMSVNYRDLQVKFEMEKGIRDKKEAILLRQIQELKNAFEDWRDWATRLQQQVQAAGLVPVPFKPRSSTSDIIMDP